LGRGGRREPCCDSVIKDTVAKKNHLKLPALGGNRIKSAKKSVRLLKNSKGKRSMYNPGKREGYKKKRAFWGKGEREPYPSPRNGGVTHQTARKQKIPYSRYGTQVNRTTRGTEKFHQRDGASRLPKTPFRVRLLKKSAKKGGGPLGSWAPGGGSQNGSAAAGQ